MHAIVAGRQGSSDGDAHNEGDYKGDGIGEQLQWCQMKKCSTWQPF